MGENCKKYQERVEAVAGSTKLCGAYDRTLDAKNRIVMPPKFKEVFNDNEEFILVCLPNDNYLSVYTEAEYDALMEEVLFPHDGVNRKRLQRFVYSRTEKCTLDAQSRFVIKPSLAELAGITRDVKMIGIGKRVELWDPESYRKDLEEFNPGSFDTPY